MEDDVVVGADGRARCWWCGDDPLLTAYHDREWGRSPTDDHALFEKLCLEGFQAGLSWRLVLSRRDALRTAFLGFDPDRIARLGDDAVECLLDADGMIRHRGKISAVLDNAHAYARIVATSGSLTAFVTRHRPPPRPRPRTRAEIPVTTTGSAALASALRTQGWRYIGPTSAYALMQSIGLVDDHVAACASAPAGAAG